MMNKPRSLYYATDKNIFDALNEHKVDSATIVELFEQRNTIVSHSTPRKWLAEYFSRLSHDYYDHKSISERLGVTARRERITSLDVTGITKFQQLKDAVQKVKDELEQHGDVVKIVGKDQDITLQIEYSKIDYRRSEFNQVQMRDGAIEFHATSAGYVVRNTQNDYINSIRDMALGEIVTDAEGGIQKNAISLFAFPEAKTRSLFFYDLFNGLSGYLLRDVTDVHVFKAGIDSDEEDLEDSFVERVSLRGHGVTRSEYLDALGNDDYYVVKVAWRCREELGKGDEFDIEAVFADPKDCTGFSYILLGVYENQNGLLSKHRRTPAKHEIAVV